MSYYRTCPICGANLDPGEICDCKNEAATVGAVTTSDTRIYDYAFSIVSQPVKLLKEDNKYA